MASSSQARSNAVLRVAAVLLCVLLMVNSFAAAAVVNVGGSGGWTIQRYGHMTLKRGDTLVFNYRRGLHNVMQVTKGVFNSCRVTSRPISTFVSGEDFVKLNTPGTYYFICGVAGHCNAGMKVAVTVR
ncbi:unnamed protein product [Calypogeia fissa]